MRGRAIDKLAGGVVIRGSEIAVSLGCHGMGQARGDGAVWPRGRVGAGAVFGEVRVAVVIVVLRGIGGVERVEEGGVAQFVVVVDAIRIASDGMATHLSSVGSAASRNHVVDFPNPSGLALNSEGMFIETPASGRAEVVQLGGNNGPARSLMQGYLELSNVRLVEEMVSLMRLMEWKRSVRGLVSVAGANPETK